jgi:hypothetical protein
MLIASDCKGNTINYHKDTKFPWKVCDGIGGESTVCATSPPPNTQKIFTMPVCIDYTTITSIHEYNINGIHMLDASETINDLREAARQWHCICNFSTADIDCSCKISVEFIMYSGKSC